jgi:hypothetical protein
MKKLTSSNISLIVGLAIPVLMVLAIAAAVLLPGRNLHPETDFVYAIGQYPTYTTREGDTITQHDLSVKDEVLTDSTQTYTPNDRYPSYPVDKESSPRLFLHSTKENTNKEITLEEAKQLRLSSEIKSPDGFKVSFGSRSYGIFPFFLNDNSDMEHAYLSNETASKEIDLATGNARNMYSFQFVGWVLP